MNLLQDLKWRYATKKFDASKVIQEDDLEKLKEAVQLSVSSYGLQLYKVLIIQNKESLSAKSDEDWQNWSEKQTYLALSNLLTACAALKIDSCPMEGFEQEKFNTILGLDQKGLNAAVIAPVGYRSAEDHTQFRTKVRKPKEILFEEI